MDSKPIYHDFWSLFSQSVELLRICIIHIEDLSQELIWMQHDKENQVFGLITVLKV